MRTKGHVSSNRNTRLGPPKYVWCDTRKSLRNNDFFVPHRTRAHSWSTAVHITHGPVRASSLVRWSTFLRSGPTDQSPEVAKSLPFAVQVVVPRTRAARHRVAPSLGRSGGGSFRGGPRPPPRPRYHARRAAGSRSGS